jgi:hypothetical protein
MILTMQVLKQLNITLNTDTKMKNIISEVANQCIEEIDLCIDKTIHWQLTDNNDDNANDSDLFELELKIKQQILFSLIKKVTK